MASPKTTIRKSFPKLAPTDFVVTSDRDQTYNCIGWAADENDRFWWPDPGSTKYYWPPDLPFDETPANFIKAFKTMGYEPCNSFRLEDGYEKLAIYTGKDGKTKHMARQLSDGTWTSKLGRDWDIKHKTLVGLEGADYGTPTQALKRPRLAKSK